MLNRMTTMNNETISDMIRIPDRKVDLVIDTDTFNEIDDQFAITYAALSPEKISLKACYATPFFNENSTSPENGMELSYEEINRVLNHINPEHNIEVFKGSRGYLKDCCPQMSSAAYDLIARSNSYTSDNPLYVVSIGALTNVMSAVLICPEIVKRIVIVWLGGHPHNWHTASEFNLNQDFMASKLLFEYSLPLVHIPCKNIAEKVSMSLPEMRKKAAGKGAIGDYLLSIFSRHIYKYELKTKPIWDITNIAYLVNPSSVATQEVTKPILGDDKKWHIKHDNSICRVAVDVDRDIIFDDFFAKLALNAAEYNSPVASEDPIEKELVTVYD